MEETGQTVQETQKVQAEQTGENGKNVGMPECETMELIMESRSENEEFARVVAAVFASRLDPTLEELDDIKTAVSEAVTNAVIHGYRGQEGKIYLSATAWEKEQLLSVTVRMRASGSATWSRPWNPCSPHVRRTGGPAWDSPSWRPSWTGWRWSPHREREPPSP